MNCLKCGRTVPDDVLLCPECLAAAKKPIRSAPEVTQEEALQQRLDKLTRRRTVLRRWIAALVILCVLGLAVLAASGWYIVQQNSRLITQSSRINSLETAMEEVRSSLEQSEAANTAMRESLAEDQKLIEAYEAYTGLSPDELAALPADPTGGKP